MHLLNTRVFLAVYYNLPQKPTSLGEKTKTLRSLSKTRAVGLNAVLNLKLSCWDTGLWLIWLLLFKLEIHPMSWETWRIKQTPNQQIGNHLVVTQLIPRWPLLGQKNFFYPVINELRGRWSQGQEQTTNGWSCLNPKSFFFVRTKDWTPLYLSIGGQGLP